MAAQSNLTSYGMIPLLAAAGGFVAATLIAIFVVQATVNSGHREIVSEAIATEVAEQINIREANLKRLVTQMGHSKLLTDVLSEGLAARSETEAVPGLKLMRFGAPQPARTVGLVRRLSTGREDWFDSLAEVIRRVGEEIVTATRQ